MNRILKNKIHSNLKFVYSGNDTLSIIFQNNDILLGVVGEFNNNLKELEKITKTNIYSRGNSILVKSDPEKNDLNLNMWASTSAEDVRASLKRLKKIKLSKTSNVDTPL